MSTPKSIIITGASSGIGAALAQAFARDGHRLFVCARRLDKLAEAMKGLPETFYTTCDVSNEAEVQRFIGEVVQRTPSIDVVIHCAAVIGPVGRITDIDSNAWLEALKTDLFGAFLVTKYAVPHMPAEKRPRIVLLSGGGAFDPMPNLSAYGISKAGIIRLAETLAVELAPLNIAVNVFAPGFVATNIFNSMLEAGPERGGGLYDTVVKLLNDWHDSDIDLPIELARYLISDESAPLTGKTISARYDPWDTPEFAAHLPDIVASRLYATCRSTLEHYKGQPFADNLAKALERRRQDRAASKPPTK